MRLKTMKYWHRYRYIWWVFIIWSIISAIMLSIFGYSLMDRRGPLEKVKADYNVTLSAEKITDLYIHGEGIKLEMVASFDTKQITASLYGDGYCGQKIKLYEQDGVGVIKLDSYPARVQDRQTDPQLTMRVIVPAKNYKTIMVESPWLVGEFYQLRGDKLLLQVDDGDLLVDNSYLKQAEVITKQGDIEISRSQIKLVNIDNLYGETSLLRNRINFGEFNGYKGDFKLYDRRIKGVWQLYNDEGDIQIQTQKEPYNLMVDLQARRGKVDISYEKGEWEDLLKAKLLPSAFQGCVGQGRHVIQAYTDKGLITMGLPK